MLRAIEREDLEHLRQWRNQQQDVLRQQHQLTPEHQTRWFDTVVLPSYRQTQPDALLVVVLDGDTLAGYGGMTNIDWISRRAELSFLASTERARDAASYRRELRLFLDWISRVAFDEVGLHRLFAETWAFRAGHISVLEQAGFLHEGTMRDHVLKDGRHHDALIHGLLVEDWRTRG